MLLLPSKYMTRFKPLDLSIPVALHRTFGLLHGPIYDKMLVYLGKSVVNLYPSYIFLSNKAFVIEDDMLASAYFTLVPSHSDYCDRYNLGQF